LGRQAARFVLTTIYVVIAAEVFLRLFAPQAVMPRYICAGDNGIRANQPNKNYWHTAPTFHVNMRINSKGLRDDREISYKKPTGVKRIVMVGDSYGMGYGVNVEDTFAQVLERAINDTGTACEVINLSVSGFGSAEESIMLTTEGFKYDPDLAIIQFNSSDPRETMASGLFALDNGSLVRENQTYLPAVGIQMALFDFPHTDSSPNILSSMCFCASGWPNWSSAVSCPQSAWWRPGQHPLGRRQRGRTTTTSA